MKMLREGWISRRTPNKEGEGLWAAQRGLHKEVAPQIGDPWLVGGRRGLLTRS